MANKITNALPHGTVLHSKSNSYVIQNALGQGSFGITYLAKMNVSGALGSLEVKVAVKEFFMRDINGRNRPRGDFPWIATRPNQIFRHNET